MALAYTAPTWEDGSGTGISASQLQALSDCMQGLVQGSDKAIHSIEFNNGIATITYADGTKENNVPANMKGISSIAKTGTAGLVDTYTITFTDGTTFNYTVTNGAPGQVQADWNENDPDELDYIKNKPTIPDVLQLYELDDSFITEFYNSNNDSIPVHHTKPGETGARQMTVENLKSELLENAYQTTNATSNSIDDANYIPFYDTDYGKQKITFQNLKAAIGGGGGSTKTITVYSAASDTLSFTDLDGSKTVTTNSSGQGSVSITYISGMVITFTSSVAKNPNNLSEDYSKPIQLLEDTTEIYVMPNKDTLYWYGYKSSNLESCTSANGWSWSSSQSMGEPTYNTNNISLNPSSGQVKGIGSKTKVTSTRIYLIATWNSGNTGGAGFALYPSKTFGGSDLLAGYTLDSTKLPNNPTCVDIPYIGESYVNVHILNGRLMTVYALWYGDNDDDLLGDKVDKTDIAPVETTSTASQAYSVGQQFYLSDGELYKCKQPIAQGATFTIGTNCELADCVTEQFTDDLLYSNDNVHTLADGTWFDTQLSYSSIKDKYRYLKIFIQSSSYQGIILLVPIYSGFSGFPETRYVTNFRDQKVNYIETYSGASTLKIREVNNIWSAYYMNSIRVYGVK